MKGSGQSPEIGNTGLGFFGLGFFGLATFGLEDFRLEDFRLADFGARDFRRAGLAVFLAMAQVHSASALPHIQLSRALGCTLWLVVPFTT